MPAPASDQLSVPVSAHDVPPLRTLAPEPANPVARQLAATLGELRAELVEIRRDLHAHPELARTEERTTRVVADRLRAAGLTPHLLTGSGLWCDIGPSVAASGVRRVALRADLDGLPVPDTCGLPWASTHKGVVHACGHDVHTTAVLGAGLALARLADAGGLETGVRLLFQPAEEVQPGGSIDVINEGGLDGVGEIFSVHCDPKLDVGLVGTRIGPITSASDEVTVTVTGRGGHTSRPHLTGDVVFALGQVVTQVPAVLGRRLDPRSGVNLTWGAVHAGTVHNAIPGTGTVMGTLRCLDVRAWERASAVFEQAVHDVVHPLGVEVEVKHQRGVPPVENRAESTGLLEEAAHDVLGPDAVRLTEQSLGGEDFAWYLQKVPGAMARLGTRTPGGHTYDIHQGDLRVDERAIEAGALLLARTAYLAGRRARV
ncbi:amidohydrolase [Cellulomonas flavigena DSM 20109]|uniref:Amidohydrolase n=1 Tax=Cellulomonas flavigena (strain ATCC 482 / DSM 20109 / BCRC 11376 / JCM 18109 / NBRC 3775 / NCIMB 8073 / NRS 134) TaxID=446466 RepID=D5UKV7_CELFN|nr:amidohydrolase [Cellulomonas flavigena]ADG73925.1 amidohydrolase [Cellulomonas flavigena DSM 20109]